MSYNICKHNQQDATLHNGIYYYNYSTCFRRFLRPSSGAQNRIHNIAYLLGFFCFLPLSWVSWNNFHDQTKRILSKVIENFRKALSKSFDSNDIKHKIAEKQNGDTALIKKIKTLSTCTGSHTVQYKMIPPSDYQIFRQIFIPFLTHSLP